MKTKLLKINSLFVGLVISLSTSMLWASESEHAVSSWQRDVLFPFINLSILLILLFVLLRKPAAEFFLTRSKQIAQSVEQSAKEKTETQAQYQHYQKRLEQIETEIHALSQNLKKEGELAREKLIEEAKIGAQKIEEVARWVSEQEFKKAKELLKGEVTEQITERAKTIIRERLTDRDHTTLLEKQLKTWEQLS